MRKKVADKLDIVKLGISFNPYRGKLFFGETGRHIPIPIRRFYFINNLLHPKIIRGMHAHKILEQVIFCVNGSFELHLDDGKKKQKVVMNNLSVGIRLRKMTWHHMTKFSPDCVIFVVASHYHKESDYIRDYNKFLRCVKNNHYGRKSLS